MNVMVLKNYPKNWQKCWRFLHNIPTIPVLLFFDKQITTAFQRTLPFFHRKLVKISKNNVIITLPLAPWQRGAVDIASASGTRRPGFESRQGIRFWGNIAMLLCINDLIGIVCMLKKDN
jgi:hypothetical protein